jgi:CheY-like chemotaxis protein
MHKGTVLVVDDDPAMLKLIRVLLEDEDYRVITTSGDAVLSIAPTLRPDVILLDVRMPGTGGVGLSRQLRENPETGHIPLIALTADLARGIREGMVADEWLGKPFNLDSLYEGVARWVGKRAAAGEAKQSTGS